ncbi:YVH1_3 [Blepharisma stoltei]|uniref:protein-tyrosine-phosphatase n=1 Tax=Blepharisma stoltei TaxID=1481888 RepID=A0AAU9J1W4_9CILI|nr:unnamed protein product [Blepharisma stoltei]
MDYPICAEILPGLFIGEYRIAQDMSLLFSNHITHVIIAAEGLEQLYTNQIHYKYLPILDTPDQDIYQYFEESIEFIENAISQGGKVLVHCLSGISRSAAIVTAYVIKHKNIKTAEALQFIQSLYPLACPNDSFMNQLVRFETFLGLLAEVPYSCKICHTQLFTKADLEEHTSQTSKKFKKGSRGNDICTSIFVRKMNWMQNTEEIDGKIECPHCMNKLGEFNWSGRQCSCGRFVAPAFQVHNSAVEAKRSNLDHYIAGPKVWSK